MARQRNLGLVAILALCPPSALGRSPDLPRVSYQELYYQQSLDHFNPISHTRWAHRYLLNDQFWDGRGKLQNGCRGPILMYAGNEAAVETYWNGNGFMINELAPRLGGLLLVPEARFYGKSLPFGSESVMPEHLAYLTTSQVMEDYIELLDHLKTKLPEASRCPVVVLGGSYGGTLAALLRATYPAVITGALAASSELGFYDVTRWAEHGITEFAFEDRAIRGYRQAHPECMSAIERAEQAIEATPAVELIKIFNVCDLQALGPNKRDLFTYALEGLPQQDYPYAVGIVPGNPVNTSCALLVEATQQDDSRAALVAAAAKITKFSQGNDGSGCIPDAGPNLIQVPGDGAGPGAWGWQSCTETMHRFSARGLRTYTFNYRSQAALCMELYGKSVIPDTLALARRFGGFALADGSAGVTRIIWSQGQRDVWGGWFQNVAKPQAGSEIHHFVLEGAAHHLDLRGSHPGADPPMVTAARKQYAEIIERWIHAASGGPVRAAGPLERLREQTIFA